MSIGVINRMMALDFGAYFVLEESGVLRKLVVGVTLALMFRNGWTLVCGHLVSALLHGFASYVVAPSRPNRQFSCRHTKDLDTFGKKVLLAMVASYFAMEFDTCLVPRF